MPEEARNGADDAVVIPIGTGGRPGRGSGSARPSSAARNLAPSARKAAKKPPDASTAKASPPRPEPAAGPTRQKVAEETGPTAGIPVGDWLSALQGAAHEVFGDDWERRLAELMAFARRRLEGDYEVDDYGFDRELTERFFMAALRPIAEKWFRLEVRGLENIPAEGGALVVSNHSGTVPLDGLMTMLTVHDHADRFLRPLGADLVFRLPVVSALARKGGATLACIEDAERMLSGGELVGVWPEGFKGIGKPFSERYKLQRFGRGGFVSAALRTGVPIIPLSVVGAEEIYPLVGNVPSLARLLGVPYIPITPFFPWLGPLGMVPLPSKWILEFGEPIRTDSYDAAEAEDPMLVFNVTDQVRETIQHTLFDLLRERDGVFS
ncbi:glycerol acyltransferase [Nocardioides eburneiflavus]|uniref:Glycerol acyltransferase n=1 Tax=Nocardioides eburneiflavus TaxID=2518372 RepID=A0A4Z1BN64_9ACTN|nr:lysophospholipid acyltransferase family protein [Nocardioides eburneiflavus]TGN62711.1 glycerol acyltransferase [Nocardioides eburneiflavus]